MTDDPRRLASELAIQKFELMVQVAALVDQMAAQAKQLEMYDATSAALVVVDKTARIHAFNAAAVRILDVSRESLQQGRIDAFVATSSVPEVPGLLEDALAGRPTRRVLQLDVRQLLPVLVTAVKLPGPTDQEPLCLLTIVDLSGTTG